MPGLWPILHEARYSLPFYYELMETIRNHQLTYERTQSEYYQHFHEKTQNQNQNTQKFLQDTCEEFYFNISAVCRILHIDEIVQMLYFEPIVENIPEPRVTSMTDYRLTCKLNHIEEELREVFRIAEQGAVSENINNEQSNGSNQVIDDLYEE